MPWVTWEEMVDFAVLSAAVYLVLRWAQQTRALRLVLGVILLYAGSVGARHAGLVITSWLMAGASIGALAMTVILFPGELRHAFLRLDAMLRLGVFRQLSRSPVFRLVADAAFSMAATKTGALLVLPGKDSIDEVVRGGIRFGAVVSSTTLEAIFEKHSVLHDGAVIISGDRIERVGAVLPLSDRADLPVYFGTRHRAAAGLSERSDAVVVVVSEERGEVTLFQDRRVVHADDATELVALLELRSAKPARSVRDRALGVLTRHLQYKLAAVLLSALIWGITVAGTQTAVRLVTVPIEFRNVPAKMEVVGQSASRVDVQVRGTPWLIDSFTARGMSVQFDLARVSAGSHRLRVDAQEINPPPGVVIERVMPEMVNVELRATK